MSAPAAALARIALLGCGEVGQTLAEDLSAAGVRDLRAWDRLFPDPSSAPRQAMARLPAVRTAASLAEAVCGCTLIVSAVTAGQCLEAAREAARALAPQAFYFDLNSVSPGTKREAASLVTAAGARYVEAAVMSPIAPRRIAVPMLIGGTHAREFAPLAQALGFTGVEVFNTQVGLASAAKMCRSVLIKGFEALLCESLLAARRQGVLEAVLPSLTDLFPGTDWERTARYFISRSALHGARRAEEMREAARAVAETGIEPVMSLACAKRQEWAAAHRPAGETGELIRLLDALLESVPTPDATLENA